ncbi:MAG: hypothetical protein R3F56_07715 [Planctomycetota bacterium]
MLVRLANLARVALLGGTLLAAVTAWVFAAHPDWVDAFDRDHVAAYVRTDTEALGRAERADAPRATVEAELLPLLARTADVRKGDRLAPCRRAAFARLARARVADGDLAGAASVAEMWRAFDPLDLDATLVLQQVTAAQAARAPAGSAAAEAARQLAAELFALAPDRERFLAPLLVDALARDDHGGVADAFFTHLRAGGTPASAVASSGWVLLADGGDGFDPVRTEPVDVRCDGDDLRVSFTPVHDSKRLRLSLPPRVAGRLCNARFRIRAGDQEVELPAHQLARQTGAAVGEQGCHYEGDDLVLEGDDAPWLLWSLGPGARIATTWTLCARVETPSPPWLGWVMALPEVGARGQALLAADDVEDAGARARYRACRRTLLARARLSLRLGEAEPMPVALRESGEGFAFAADVRRLGATRLRLTLPALAAIEVVASPGVMVTGGRAPNAVQEADTHRPRAAQPTLPAAAATEGGAPPWPWSRLLPSAGVIVGGVTIDGVGLSVRAPSAVLEFEFSNGDPDEFSLVGSVR